MKKAIAGQNPLRHNVKDPAKHLLSESHNTDLLMKNKEG